MNAEQPSNATGSALKQRALECWENEGGEVSNVQPGRARMSIPFSERLAGLLAGEGALNYFPVGERFSLVELPVPAKWVGASPTDLNLRKKKRINVVAVRKQAVDPQSHAWSIIDPEHAFTVDEIVLVAGSRKDLEHLE